MKTSNNGILSDNPFTYKASLTREQFLFFEMRTTAKLMVEGLPDEQILDRIMGDNLFQYPTEKSVRGQTRACLSRLNLLNDSALVTAIATQPTETAKQACLYALMKYNRLVWDFMVTVVGEKYRLMDSSFGKIDLNTFFMRLQEQNDAAATWSDTTVAKLKQVLVKLLVENDYLDSVRADHINPVWLNPLLENSIRANSDDAALPAFNCFA